MSEPTIQQIERLFQAVIDRPAVERDALLAEAAVDEPAVATRVEALLRQHDLDVTLGPASGQHQDSGAPAGEHVGDAIGRYVLRERIGEGGFGVVYRAEQQTPVVREVALKVIKLGMDTREVVARFDAERQALALMDHPSIAKVFDADTTTAGRPYFVMELVDGTTITEYCDARQLGTGERLALFAEVCRAVQHAHQKGVIHRDLKPSNILVTEHDGRAVPKVIDFGVAKAIDHRLTEQTVLTHYQRLMGTPAYMSPEQAELSAVDVDTRTDIYSLGVLLYELLTGETPFDADTLWRAGLAEMQRILREQPPLRPSARVGITVDARGADRRRTNQTTLHKRLRGDLDWIVMKALAKERERRYGAASDLAADVMRHLDGQPVLAGPPSAFYRLRKFLARNRAAVVSAALVSAAVMAGVVGTGYGAWMAARERDQAHLQAVQSEQVLGFLTQVMSLADPAVAQQPDLSVRRLLDLASARVDDAFVDQPIAEGRVRSTIGRAYASLGEHLWAEAHLRRAVDLFDAAYFDDRATLYSTLWTLTHVAFRLETPDAYATASRARREGFAYIAERQPEVAAALTSFHRALSDAAHRLDQEAIEATLPRFEAARVIAETRLAAQDPLWEVIADTFMDVGYQLWYTEHEPYSEPFYAAAVGIRRRVLPATHPDLARAVGQWVTVLNRAGQPERAAAEMRATVDAMRGLYDQSNFQRAHAESLLGETLVAQGHFAEAEAFLVDSHEVIVDAVAQPQNFFVVDSYGRLIALYEGWGNEVEAARYRDALAPIAASGAWGLPWPLARRVFGPEHTALLLALDRVDTEVGGIGYAVTAGDARPDDLDAAIEDVERLLETTTRPNDPRREVIARMLLVWANSVAADAGVAARTRIADRAIAELTENVADMPNEVAEALSQRAELRARAGEMGAARTDAAEASRLIRMAFVEDNWLTAIAKARIGRRLVAVGDVVNAEALLRPTVLLLEAQFGPEHRHVRDIRAVIDELERKQRERS